MSNPVHHCLRSPTARGPRLASPSTTEDFPLPSPKVHPLGVTIRSRLATWKEIRRVLHSVPPPPPDMTDCRAGEHSSSVLSFGSGKRCSISTDSRATTTPCIKPAGKAFRSLKDPFKNEREHSGRSRRPESGLSRTPLGVSEGNSGALSRSRGYSCGRYSTSTPRSCRASIFSMSGEPSVRSR